MKNIPVILIILFIIGPVFLSNVGAKKRKAKKKKVVIASVSIIPAPWDKEYNIKKTENWIRRAARRPSTTAARPCATWNTRY